MAEELKENDSDNAVVANLEILNEDWWNKVKTAKTARLKQDCLRIALQAVFGQQAKDNPSELDIHQKITVSEYGSSKELLQILLEWLSDYDGQTNDYMHHQIIMLLITLTSAFPLQSISPSMVSDCFDIVTGKIWCANETTAHLGSELLLKLWLRVCCASIYIKCKQLVVMYTDWNHRIFVGNVF